MCYTIFIQFQMRTFSPINFNTFKRGMKDPVS